MTTLAWWLLASIVVAAVVAPFLRQDEDDSLPEGDPTIDNIRFPK